MCQPERAWTPWLRFPAALAMLAFALNDLETKVRSIEETGRAMTQPPAAPVKASAA